MTGTKVKTARRAAIAEGRDPKPITDAIKAQRAKLKEASASAKAVAEIGDKLVEAVKTGRVAPTIVDQHTARAPTAMETKYIEFRALGMSPASAARHAGYSKPKIEGPKIEKNKNVAPAIAVQRQKFEEAGQITKKMVLDGFLEAIEMGKLLSDPITMVAGWREIAKVCGYYSEQKHSLTISVEGNLMVQKIQTLSDHELLKLAEGDVIEGEIVPEGRKDSDS